MRWKILIVVIFSVILFGVISASATQHPDLVEMKLEAYIFDVTNGIIKMCVDVYCHGYYEGSGSISETFLIPPGTYNGSLEWTHTKTDCKTDNENVCAASGKVVVPNEKDGSLTIQAWNQYDLGERVFNNQKITFTVTIPDFGISPEPEPEPTPEPTPEPIPDPTPDPMTEQRLTDLEQRMDVQEQEWEEFKIKTKDMFP